MKVKAASQKVHLPGFVLCALLALCSLADAQQGKSLARVGFLSSRSPEAEKSRLAAFQQGMRELGYVEGKTLKIEQRYAEGTFGVALLDFESLSLDVAEFPHALLERREAALLRLGRSGR